jgi:3-oxoacyl-[acyl-carrier protein] reductase
MIDERGMMSETRFENQVAIVTGGASGLGKAVVSRLAREGAAVTIFDTNEAGMQAVVAELSATHLAVFTHVVDVSDKQSVQDGIQSVYDTHGRLDIVVNCAGVVGPNGKTITDVSVEDFDDVYRINLRGSFLMAKYALDKMTKNDYGRILLIASIAGKEGNAGMTSYSATKSGVIGLVKAVGKEYAETGITVNGLAPAVVWTPLVDDMDPAQVDYMTSRIPMKRCATLDEVAAMVCWIVSKEASFNTGFVFDLSGGRATY